METVTLERANADAAPLLQNLLELYVHDLSAVFDVQIGPDGRFGYDKLPLYWADPVGRYAFLIKYGSRLAGFALATRGSPATDCPTDLDVSEFFVLRGCRRMGVGLHAAWKLWDIVPGQWVVRVVERNEAGLRFWGDVIRAYTDGVFDESTLGAMSDSWRVFTFASRAYSPSR